MKGHCKRPLYLPQNSVIRSSPTQSKPPFSGEGLSQARVRLLTEPPQLAGHSDHNVHSLQSPCTTTIYHSKLILVIMITSSDMKRESYQLKQEHKIKKRLIVCLRKKECATPHWTYQLPWHTGKWVSEVVRSVTHACPLYTYWKYSLQG